MDDSRDTLVGFALRIIEVESNPQETCSTSPAERGDGDVDLCEFVILNFLFTTSTLLTIVW